ncbi:MAG TPA: enoyl-ACP reductase [Chloroflexia bacterium]|nr:enoyl-ACP reductase [Chloroflexia bacterium]
MPNLLEGKNALIMGVADKHSIAWGITKAFSEAGANIILTFQNERLRSNVEKLAATLERKPTLIGPCDVQNDAELDQVFSQVSETFGGKLDVYVHAVAFAAREDLRGEFASTSRSGFQLALDISSYSLIACTNRAKPLLEAAGGGSVITLTYLGSERVVKNYNVMGVAKAALEANVRYLANELGPSNIRVNAISAGPIKTLAAQGGVAGFSKMLESVKEINPLRRNVDTSEVGDVAVFLGSQMSRAVTGEILFVDNGYHILGMMASE